MRTFRQSIWKAVHIVRNSGFRPTGSEGLRPVNVHISEHDITSSAENLQKTRAPATL